MYVRDGSVVFEETSDDGIVRASAFRVVHDHVTSVFRHASLARPWPPPACARKTSTPER